MVMSDPLSVNLKHFKQKVNIKDSLELIDYRTKRKSLKCTKRFQNCDSDFSVESDHNQNTSQFYDSELTSPYCNKYEDSSIEETRDATTSYLVQRQLPNCQDLCLELDRSKPINSTLLECNWAAPIADCNHPLISPIEDNGKQRFIEGQISPQSLIKTQRVDSSIVANHPEFTRPDEFCSSDSDEDWLPGEESRCLDASIQAADPVNPKVRKCDPKWPENPPMLHAIPPATYTPRKRDSRLLKHLNKPVKKGLRTSSPDEEKVIPKARKSLIENLDLSSILSDVEYGDSIELLPRPPTPGTVNSDEILPPDYTLPSPGESAGDKHIIACEDLRVIISRSDQEICFNALNDRRKAVCWARRFAHSDDKLFCLNSVSSIVGVPGKSQMSHLPNTCSSPMSYVVADDVIERCPSPIRQNPIYVKTIKDWRLSAVRDVLEMID